MDGRPVCRFFQQGKCRNGASCKFSHDAEQPIMTDQPMQSNISTNEPRICKFFLEGNCQNPKCNMIHAYSANLDHVILEEEFHTKQIVGMCQINSSKFVTADENNVSIWEITDTKKFIGKQEFPSEKIKKIVFSNGKIIVLSQIDKMLTSQPKMHVLSDNFTASLDVLNMKTLNDAIEIDSYILGVGDNMIQAFTIEQGVINLGPVAVNTLDKSEIICINYHANSNIFFCGHINGNISAWNISQEEKFLKCIANSKIHEDSINSITFKDNYIITCSSDFNLKVFNLDNNFENVLIKNFESPIYNFTTTKNTENVELFLINLANGNVLVTDQNFNIIIKIPSMKNSSHRFSINLSNKLANENDGNFLIISDGNALNVNMWVKNVSKSLKNINSQKYSHHKHPQNLPTHRNDQYRESHIKHQIPNQLAHFPNQEPQTHHPNRGGFSSYAGRGRGSSNFGGRGGYQGGNRFDRNDGNFPQNFSYQRK